MYIKESIKQELLEHIKDLRADGVLNEDNFDDWHFHAFNEDYYIIGHYNAEQWLERHGLSAWEAIETVRDYELDNFGEHYTDTSTPEAVVNMYVYIAGEQLI